MEYKREYKSHKLCVIIPIYKSKPEEPELFSIRNTMEKMRGTAVFLIAPKGLDLTAYGDLSGAKTLFLNPASFSSLFAYNKLLLSIRFYTRFIFFKYILIVQPDALILRDAAYLLKLIEGYGYDYWGAPWMNTFERGKIDCSLYNKELAELDWAKRLMPPMLKCEVGNGGLSLRNTAATIRLLIRRFRYKRFWGGPEDCFFAYFGQLDSKGYKLADREAASLFSLEETLHDRLHKQELPFGIHDWKDYFPEVMTYWKEMEDDPGFFRQVFPYETGRTLYFDAQNFNASPYIISGVSLCEPGFSWFVSRNVELAFRIERPEDTGASLQLIFFIDQTFGEQPVRIYANGKFLGERLLSGPGELDVGIPEPAWPDIMLRLEFPDARQPESYAVGNDIRSISIAVTKMESYIRGGLAITRNMSI